MVTQKEQPDEPWRDPLDSAKSEYEVKTCGLNRAGQEVTKPRRIARCAGSGLRIGAGTKRAGLHQASQPRDRRMAVNIAHRYRRERRILPQLRNHPRGKQRVTAKIEEKIVVDGNLLSAEQRLPYLRQFAFCTICRKGSLHFVTSVAILQRSSIELAALQPRQIAHGLYL